VSRVPRLIGIDAAALLSEGERYDRASCRYCRNELGGKEKHPCPLYEPEGEHPTCRQYIPDSWDTGEAFDA
jgi:hypothetical protein